MLSGGDPNYNSHADSPWWDIRIMPPEARAAVKVHAQ